MFNKINIMKTLLSLLASVLLSASTFAQLSVKPAANNDASYIYVKDEVLFVQGNIDLDENSASTTEKASIYLREGGQLLQGDDSSVNSGYGYISIYQNTPDSDAWDYTFWSAPVGDQSLSQTGNTNFGATRFFDVIDLTNSTVNIPINSYDGIQSPMQIAKFWLYTYTAANGWSAINDASNVIPGRGFTSKGLGYTNHDQTYDFRGRPNNGTITAPITNDAKNLSGNPYPSALDLNAVFYHPDNTEIESFKYWDEDHSVNSHYYVDYVGGYGTWIPLGEDPGGTNPGMYTQAPFLNYNNDGSTGSATGNTGADYKRRFAPVGQGYMLYGSNTGSITYNNAQRVFVKEDSGTSDFRSNDGSPLTNGADEITIIPTDDRIPHLRLNTYFNDSHMRQLVLAFSNEATDDIDRGFDALSPMDADSDSFFPIGNMKRPHVIQTVNFERYKHIPYTLTLDVRTNVVVNLTEKVNFNEYSVYLYDNVEDTYQEIKSEDERSVQLQLLAGLYEDRFFIAFVDVNRTQQLAKEEIKDKVLEDVDFFQNNTAKQLEIANPEGYDIASANIFDMSGKLVYMASNLGNNSRFTFPTGNLSDGIYLVMLTTKENIAVNYKITVKNR